MQTSAQASQGRSITVKRYAHASNSTSEAIRLPVAPLNMHLLKTCQASCSHLIPRGGRWVRKYHTDTLALQETVNQESLLFSVKVESIGEGSRSILSRPDFISTWGSIYVAKRRPFYNSDRLSSQATANFLTACPSRARDTQ